MFELSSKSFVLPAKHKDGTLHSVNNGCCMHIARRWCGSNRIDYFPLQG